MYLLRRVNDWGFCLHGMGGRAAHSHCWRAWSVMERIGYRGNHFAVVAVFVVATTAVGVVDGVTWSGFGSRFRTSVHSGNLDFLKIIQKI